MARRNFLQQWHGRLFLLRREQQARLGRVNTTNVGCGHECDGPRNQALEREEGCAGRAMRRPCVWLSCLADARRLPTPHHAKAVGCAPGNSPRESESLRQRDCLNDSDSVLRHVVLCLATQIPGPRMWKVTPEVIRASRFPSHSHLPLGGCRGDGRLALLGGGV